MQATGLRWTDGYLTCQLDSETPNSIKLVHARISDQIKEAIDNLYQQGDDPVAGAFSRKTPNVTLNGRRHNLVLIIPNDIDEVDTDVVEAFYTDLSADELTCLTSEDVANYREPSDSQAYQYIDVLRACYSPATSNPSILQPLLFLDKDSHGVFTLFSWTGAVYQIETNPIDRYDIDICTQYGRCRFDTNN